MHSAINHLLTDTQPVPEQLGVHQPVPPVFIFNEIPLGPVNHRIILVEETFKITQSSSCTPSWKVLNLVQTSLGNNQTISLLST